MNPSIIAFPDRFTRGWPKADDPRSVLAPVGDLLTEQFPCDAHFVAYAADVPRRHTIALFKDPANADKIPIANLRMVLAVFDVDGPGHVREPAWWDGELGKITRLESAHPGGFLYATRGGWRAVYALPEPYPLRCQADDDAWTTRYLSWCRYLRRRFGIEADDACADWTHLYRLPLVTRDGVPQEPWTTGNPHELGAWTPSLLPRDVKSPGPSAPTFGAVEPIPIGNLDSLYAFARVEAGERYLSTCALSIEGQAGRTVLFSICCYLVRRLRLPIDVAAFLVEEVYNPRLIAAGTTPWLGGELLQRLESARDTASVVPPGDVPDEAAWNALLTKRTA